MLKIAVLVSVLSCVAATYYKGKFGPHGFNKFRGFGHMGFKGLWGMQGRGRQPNKSGYSKNGMMNGYQNSPIHGGYMNGRMSGLSKGGFGGFIDGGYLKGRLSKSRLSINAGYPKGDMNGLIGGKFSKNKMNLPAAGLRGPIEIGFPGSGLTGSGDRLVSGMMDQNVGSFDGSIGREVHLPGFGEWNSLATTNLDMEPMGFDRFSNGEFGPFDGTFGFSRSHTGF